MFKDEETTEYYRINSIYELKNGNLIFYNKFGIKIYEKTNDKYELNSMKEITKGISKVIKVKNNVLAVVLGIHIFYVSLVYINMALKHKN